MTVTADQLAAIIAELTDGQPVAVRSAKPRCRGTGCTEKLDPFLVDQPDNTGLHLLCEEPAAPPEPAPVQLRLDAPAPAPIPEPPSTVGYVRDILTRYSINQPRSLQVALGPSDLGTPCQRQIAYKLAGIPKRPITEPEWAPLQGTAMHTLMEDALRYENGALGRDRWIIEQRVQIDEQIGGRGDAYDTDNGLVVDWKYTGTTALNKLRAAKRAGKPPAEQVSTEYRVQAHLYGYGHEQAGRDVKFVRLVLLARSWKYDDSDEWTEAYSPEIALAAVDRYYATHDLLNALNPVATPTLWGAVPAAPTDEACRWCPFRRVGGPADDTGCPGVTTSKVEKFADGLIAPQAPAPTTAPANYPTTQ